jgi:two-component system copper resistance phosphate regulon response regulator CusR
MGEMTILLIEDNSAVTETLSLALSGKYRLHLASSGELALELIGREIPDILILDASMPDISGIEFLRKVRKIGVKAPILILSGENNLRLKLELYEAGADDYLLKPFSLGELKARLAVYERHIIAFRLATSTLSTPSLVLDKSNCCVVREGGVSIDLRRKEFAILEYLIINAGQTVSRANLAAHAWNNMGEPWSNSVAVHIKHLRDKIDKPYAKNLITTIHGYGYRLEVT